MDQGIKVIALEFLIVVDLPDAHFHSVLLEKQRDRVLRTLLLARALNKLLHESPILTLIFKYIYSFSS